MPNRWGRPVELSVKLTVNGGGPINGVPVKSAEIADAPAMRKEILIIIANKKKFDRMHIHKNLLLFANHQSLTAYIYPYIRRSGQYHGRVGTRRGL